MEIKKQILAVIQARMNSTRLPGKVLKKIGNLTCIEILLKRLSKSKLIDQIIVVTSTNQHDDILYDKLSKIGVDCFRGDETNVYKRFHDVVKNSEASVVVRITADCPLIDPRVIEKVINYFHASYKKYDYVSNILEPSYPIGLHTELFSIDALEKANNNSIDPIEREHVTPYIYRNPDFFELGSVVFEENFSNHRWTIDYPEDFVLIRKIIEELYPLKDDFDMFDIISFLETKPELMLINNNFKKEQTL